MGITYALRLWGALTWRAGIQPQRTTTHRSFAQAQSAGGQAHTVTAVVYRGPQPASSWTTRRSDQSQLQQPQEWYLTPQSSSWLLGDNKSSVKDTAKLPVVLWEFLKTSLNFKDRTDKNNCHIRTHMGKKQPYENYHECLLLIKVVENKSYHLD